MLAPALTLLLTVAALAGAAPAGAATAAFPKGFTWGVAMAGFQSDMALGSSLDKRSDWWSWTHDAGNIDAKRVTTDDPGNGPGFWQLYKYDTRLARRQLGVGAFRMSLEWSRIFPRSTASVKTGTTITERDLRRLDRLADPAAVSRYRAMLGAIRSNGMRPLVTVNHFTLPLWIHDPVHVRDAFFGRAADAPVPQVRRGGWLDASTVDEFRKYSAYVAWKFGGLVDDWVPINEPMVVVVNGYANVPGVTSGNFPPGVLSFPAALRATTNLALANAASYDAIKRWDRGDANRDGRRARVGVVQNMVDFTPGNTSQDQVDAAHHADDLFNRLFLDAAVKGEYDANADGTITAAEQHPKLAGKADFVGVNYYFRGRVMSLAAPLTPTIPLLDFVPTTTYRWAQNRSAPACPTFCSDFGSEIDPRGFRSVLATAGSYGLPVIVTENGVADATDALRPKYLHDHLAVLQQAIADHVADVRGYYAWSLTDNFEWAAGYAPKFGFYAVDRATLRRRPRTASIKVFREATRTNAVPSPPPVTQTQAPR